MKSICHAVYRSNYCRIRALAWLGVFTMSVLSPISLCAQSQTVQEDQQGTREEQEYGGSNRVQFLMEERPTIQIGGVFRVEIEAKLQADFRRFSPALTDVENNELSRARFGLKGRILEHFYYEVEREFKGTFGAPRPKFPWRDVYGEVRDYGPFDLKAGKFKLPFGMEENTSEAKLDFVNRSLASESLTPGRDKGIMASGQLLKKLRLNYAVGVFQNDGENVHEKDDTLKSGGRTFAAHLNGEPLRRIGFPLRRLQIGTAVTLSNVPESTSPSKNSIRGDDVAGETFFHRIFVQGTRLRFGTEMNWTSGPFSIKGEFIRTSEERKGMGLEMQDLPDFITRGWYLAGTWLVTGEKKSESVRPAKDFITGRGIGAVELAARYEALLFGSASNLGIPSRSPRAPNILANSDRVLTFGVNWYLNRFSKIQINGVREVLEDPQSVPIPGHNRYWTTVVRLHFHM